MPFWAILSAVFLAGSWGYTWLALHSIYRNFSSLTEQYLLLQGIEFAPGGRGLFTALEYLSESNLLLLLTAVFTAIAFFLLAVRYGWTLATAGTVVLVAFCWNWALGERAFSEAIQFTTSTPQGWVSQEFSLMVLAGLGIAATVLGALLIPRLRRAANFRNPLLATFLLPSIGLGLLLFEPELEALPYTWESLYWTSAGGHAPVIFLAVLGGLSLCLFGEGFTPGYSRGASVRLSAVILVSALVLLVSFKGLEVSTPAPAYPSLGGISSKPAVGSSYLGTSDYQFRLNRLKPTTEAHLERAVSKLQGNELSVPTLDSMPTMLAHVRDSLGRDRFQLLRNLRKLESATPDTSIESGISPILMQHPLTDPEVDTWMELVTERPTPLREDLALLTNLVGSARKYDSRRLISHIRQTLDRVPAVHARKYSSSASTAGNGEFARLLDILAELERRSGEIPSVSPGSEYRLRLRVVDDSGMPLSGVQVGVFQSLTAALGIQHPGEAPPEKRPPVSHKRAYFEAAKFRKSGEDGEALFSDLRPSEYGVVVLSEQSQSGPLYRIFRPRTNLPSPLSEGETELTLEAVPSGTYRLTSSGSVSSLDIKPRPPAGETLEVLRLERIQRGLIFNAPELNPRIPRQDTLSTLRTHADYHLLLIEKSAEGVPEQVWFPAHLTAPSGGSSQKDSSGPD